MESERRSPVHRERDVQLQRAPVRLTLGLRRSRGVESVMAESRINPYQGPSGREGNTPPAWSIANFARYFRPSMFETQPPGAIAAPAVAPAGGASTFRPGGQFGFEGNGTINRDENFNLNAPGGGAAAGEEGQATGTGPITADTGARAQTQEA